MNSKYDGMTVNERLFEAKLLDEYDLAVKKRDKKTLVKILKQVALSEEQQTPLLMQSFQTLRNMGMSDSK